MNDRDQDKFSSGQDTDISKSQSGQQPASTKDDTQAGQTGGFQQPTSGSDQQVDSAGETTTLGQQGTDIEGEGGFGEGETASSQGSTGQTGSSQGGDQGGFVGSEGQQDTSSSLVDGEQNIDKDGQSPLEGE